MSARPTRRFPYYWPVKIPKPSNLSDASQSVELQRASSCDIEADSLGLVPSACEGLPLDVTLPVCVSTAFDPIQP